MRGLIDTAFWQNKRVLLTGHTGFKGAWMLLLLERLGADVMGIALAPETSPNLFDILRPGVKAKSVIADIRNPSAFSDVAAWRPQIVIHMAAQPLVRRSYAEPVETFGTNVMGTVNLLDMVRQLEGIEAVLVITTDKVYRNDDAGRAFVEDDPLGGHDPYSASKAAAEMAVFTYAHSYFAARNVPVATARAGNVIGGGDWSADRIIPDIWRSHRDEEAVVLRMPKAVRPWQHVIEPIAGYLVYCQALVRGDDDLPRALNFGPPASDNLTVAEVTERMLGGLNSKRSWVLAEGPAPREMKLLSLNPAAAVRALGWKTRMTAGEAIDLTSRWYRQFDDGADMIQVTKQQIDEYLTA